ncbi:MAG TPA: c-type cytochrome [Burkholderiaceae bacterium]
MKTSLFVLATLFAATSALAETPAELAQKKTCMACHQIDKKVVGPAFKEVAAKYAKDKDAVNKLVASITKGGTGKWGTGMMPPGMASEAEAKILAQWILTQK